MKQLDHICIKLMATAASLLFISCNLANAQESEQQANKTLSPYFVVISDNPETDNLPLKENTVKADIIGAIADVNVRQTFVNNGKHTLEAIYTFPLSTRAAVYSMKMTIGNRTIHDAHPQGALTVAQVIQKSSNVGTVKMAMQMQPREMWELFSAVGFGQRPAVEVGEGLEAQGVATDDGEHQRQAVARRPHDRLRAAADPDPRAQAVLGARIHLLVREGRTGLARPGDLLLVEQQREQVELLLEEGLVVVEVVAEEREALDERAAPRHDFGATAGDQPFDGTRQMRDHLHPSPVAHCERLACQRTAWRCAGCRRCHDRSVSGRARVARSRCSPPW